MADLRQAFFNFAGDLAREDKDVIVLVGDLGYSFMEDFAKEFPDQFVNCGIAEQNMVGVSAGLARAGKKPFVYSGALFLMARALEQIRVDIAYANLNVKLVGTGASGFLGFTHNLGEDENFDDAMKRYPNLKCVNPTDEEQLKWHMSFDGPRFIKL